MVLLPEEQKNLQLQWTTKLDLEDVFQEYRARNADDSGTTVKDFFTEAIGYPNVLVVDSMLPEGELLPKMKEIIE